MRDTSFLEVEVLERLGSAAEELGRPVGVGASQRKVSLRDPGRGEQARRLEALERLLGGFQPLGGLVEAVLLEQRAPEYELDVADLVECVFAAAEEVERVARLRLCELRVARAEMNLGERRDRVAGVDVVGLVEADRDRVLEVGDGLVRMPSRKLSPPRLFSSLPTFVRSPHCS